MAAFNITDNTGKPINSAETARDAVRLIDIGHTVFGSDQRVHDERGFAVSMPDLLSRAAREADDA